MIKILPVRDTLSRTSLKMMDGNPLDQNKDISPDDQDGTRTDYNNPSRENDHEVEYCLWTSAPHTRLQEVDTTKYNKLFFRIPKETIDKTFEATTRLGRVISGELAWSRLCNDIKAPNP
jgi:hypothetical protein